MPRHEEIEIVYAPQVNNQYLSDGAVVIYYSFAVVFLGLLVSLCFGV